MQSTHHMSGPEDFKLGHKHNAGDPEGRRVMQPPVPVAEPVAWLQEREDGRSRIIKEGQAADCDASWGYKVTPLYAHPPVPVAEHTKGWNDALTEAAQFWQESEPIVAAQLRHMRKP